MPQGIKNINGYLKPGARVICAHFYVFDLIHVTKRQWKLAFVSA